MLEYQNIKIFLQNAMFSVGQKKCLWFKKVKTLCRGHMLLVILMVKNCWNIFEKELHKINQKEYRVEKVIKGKGW